MDTRKNSISYASFITKIYHWLFFYLERKGILKHVALLSVVLFCTIVRYVVISFDDIPVKPARATSTKFKMLKLPVASAQVILKSELNVIKYQHKIKQPNFKKAGNSSLYIYALN